MVLKEIIDRFGAVPEHSMQTFAAAVTEVSLRKGVRLFHEGKRGTKGYFIRTGLVRAYAGSDDKEVTFWFGTDGDVILPLRSLVHAAAEYADVELLEDSTFYEIGLTDLRHLYASDINIANWGRMYAQWACAQSERLFIARQFRTSTDLYEELIRQHPGLLQRVPLGIIASYLGTSQANLSRIRAKIR